MNWDRTCPRALPERFRPLRRPGVKGCALPLPLGQKGHNSKGKNPKLSQTGAQGPVCMWLPPLPQGVPGIPPSPGRPTEAVISHPSDSPNIRMGEGGEWEMSDHSRLGGFFFLEIYSGLLHLTPLIDGEWLLCRRQKENVTGLLFHVLKDLSKLDYIWHRNAHGPSDLIGRRRDRPSKESAPSVSSSRSSKSGVSACPLPRPGEHRMIPTVPAVGREVGRRGACNSRTGPDICDHSSVISFRSSKSMCSYALDSPLGSRCSLGSS